MYLFSIKLNFKYQINMTPSHLEESLENTINSCIKVIIKNNYFEFKILYINKILSNFLLIYFLNNITI